MMISNPSLTQHVVAQGLLEHDDLFVLDVGASGGLHPSWQVFGPHLRGLGFDPLVAEVERLNRANTQPKVSYIDASVGVLEAQRRTPDQWIDDRVPGQSNLRTKISSSFRATTLLGLDDQREVFNGGSEIVLSPRRVALGTFLPEADRPAVDFIKIDTDGTDFEVLQGAEALFAAGGVLGVNVECQFHGPVDDRANVFCNIDRFLRQRGFSFYDMAIARYSRAVLPQPFELNLPAQSIRGQACRGDAIYFRDLADPHCEAMWGARPSRAKRLKLVCLFELFGFPDCAVELLQRDAVEFAEILDLPRCFDLLTPAIGEAKVGYAEYQRQFDGWIAQKQYRRFGRELLAQPRAPQRKPEPTPAVARAEGEPPMDSEAMQLCQTIGRKLGRSGPISGVELQHLCATLNHLMAQRDVSGYVAKHAETLPRGVLPLIQFHRKQAQREQNVLLGQVLEGLHGLLATRMASLAEA